MKRSEARAANLTKYFTGKLCNRGHDSYRYTATGQCAKCNTENAAKYRNGIRPVVKSVTLKVHPDDVEMLKAFATTLGLQR